MNCNISLLYLKRVSVGRFSGKKIAIFSGLIIFNQSVDNLINRVYISPLILIENCSLGSFTNMKKNTRSLRTGIFYITLPQILSWMAEEETFNFLIIISLAYHYLS